METRIGRIKITIKFLSTMKHLVGFEKVEIEFDNPPRFSEILAELHKKLPKMSKIEEELRKRGVEILYVVDGKGVKPEDLIEKSSVIYVLPPASGG